jgi:hypothetical protein
LSIPVRMDARISTKAMYMQMINMYTNSKKEGSYYCPFGEKLESGILASRYTLTMTVHQMKMLQASCTCGSALELAVTGRSLRLSPAGGL